MILQIFFKTKKKSHLTRDSQCLKLFLFVYFLKSGRILKITEKHQKVTKISKKSFERFLSKIYLYFFSIFNIELMQLPIFESVGAYLVAP